MTPDMLDLLLFCERLIARLKRDDLPLTPYQDGTPDAELLAEYEKLTS